MIVVWFSAKGRSGFYFLPKNATMNGKRTRRFSRTTCYCGWTTWVPPTSCRMGPPATPPRGFGISWKISCSRSLTGLGTVRIWVWLKTCGTSWKGNGRTKTSALPPSWSTSWRRSCRQQASSRTTAGVWATPCQVLSSRCWLPRGSHQVPTENLPEKNDSSHLINISKKLGNILENMLAGPHILHRYCLYNKL